MLLHKYVINTHSTLQTKPSTASSNELIVSLSHQAPVPAPLTLLENLDVIENKADK